MKPQKKLRMCFDKIGEYMKKLFEIINTVNFKSILLSFFSTICLPYVLKIEPYRISNSVILFVIWWSFFHVIKNALQKNNKEFLRFSFVMGCIYSFLLYIGKNCEMYGNFDVSFWGILKTAFITVGFSFILTAFIEMICRTISDKKIFNKADKLNNFFKYDRRYFLKVWWLIMICWLPFWIIMQPAIFNFDLPVQIPEAVSGNLTNWHPVLHTLYVYYSLLAGVKFFNSCEIGCIIYVIPQYLILSAIFAYCLSVFAKQNVSKLVRLLSFLFFAFYPVNWYFAISLTKDVLFSGFILLLTTLLFECSCDKKLFLNDFKKCLLLLIAIFGVLFFRTNGFVILLLALPLILFLFRFFK